MNESLTNFEWAAFTFNKVIHRFQKKKRKFSVDDALWPLRNERMTEEKSRKRDTIKAYLNLLQRSKILMNKMVSNTAEVQTIIIEPADC